MSAYAANRSTGLMLDMSRISAAVRARIKALGEAWRSYRSNAQSVHFSTLQQIANGTYENPTIDTLNSVADDLDARWDIRLLPATTRERDPERWALIEKFNAMVDRLEEKDVRQLMRELRGLEEEAELERQRQGRNST